MRRWGHLPTSVLMCVVRKGAKVGNFVEVKKTELGEGSKANHLSYLGDAKIGKGVNIGAGTITCNYDGVRKAETIIEDGVFIGSDTQLVAPVTVGAGSVIAAGTTVTENVPKDSLVISRGRQVTTTRMGGQAASAVWGGRCSGVRSEAVQRKIPQGQIAKADRQAVKQSDHDKTEFVPCAVSSDMSAARKRSLF